MTGTGFIGVCVVGWHGEAKGIGLVGVLMGIEDSVSIVLKRDR